MGGCGGGGRATERAPHNRRPVGHASEHRVGAGQGTQLRLYPPTQKQKKGATFRLVFSAPTQPTPKCAGTLIKNCRRRAPRVVNIIPRSRTTGRHTQTLRTAKTRTEHRKAVERKLLRNSRAVLDVFRSVGREWANAVLDSETHLHPCSVLHRATDHKNRPRRSSCTTIATA